MSKSDQALQEAFKTIEKQFGKGAIMKLGDNANLGQVNTYHSGSYVLDIILGGGYPEGRIIEIFGPESSGKTTLALHAIAAIQQKGEIAAFIDAEHALDPQYAKNLGVDTDNLLLSQPDYGEQALQITEELAKTGAVKIVVIDSVAAMVPKTEVEGDMGDSYMGLQARMMSQGLRKLASILAKSGTIVIFLNQIRMKIGVLYGNPETTPGGNALKYYTSQRIDIRRGDKIEVSKEQVGYIAKIKIVKNKIAAPHKSTELVIMFNKGINKINDIIESAMLLGFIKRAGAFYSIGDQKTQGKEKLVELLQKNTDIVNKLEEDIIKQVKELRMGKQIVSLSSSADEEPIEE